MSEVHSTLCHPVRSARCPTCGEWRGTLPARAKPACGACGKRLVEWRELGCAMQPMEWQRVTLQGAPVPNLSHSAGRPDVPSATNQPRAGRRKRYCIHGHDITVVGRDRNNLCKGCIEERKKRARAATAAKRKVSGAKKRAKPKPPAPGGYRR